MTLILLEQKINLNVIKTYVKIKILCGIVTYILKFNQYMNPDITPCITYADFESLIKK